MSAIAIDEFVDQVADKVLERLALLPEKTGEQDSRFKSWWANGGAESTSEFSFDSFSGGQILPPMETPEYFIFPIEADEVVPEEKTDDFADVMRNGLGAIVAWFNEDAGNTEPEEVERYSLRLELAIFDDGNGEAAVYNEGKYLGDVDLTPDNIADLFNRG